jgi:hypothetical protein
MFGMAKGSADLRVTVPALLRECALRTSQVHQLRSAMAISA